MVQLSPSVTTWGHTRSLTASSSSSWTQVDCLNTMRGCQSSLAWHLFSAKAIEPMGRTDILRRIPHMEQTG